jgi:deoxyribodipyrimidine photolyase-related protein
MTAITLIFPHQLFRQHPALSKERSIYLVEEHLFFTQYNFHRQKIRFHRASMQFYRHWLQQQGYQVVYVEAREARSDVRVLIPSLSAAGAQHIAIADPSDAWLESRLWAATRSAGIPLQVHETPMFLNNRTEIAAYFGHKKKYFQTDFYTQQRKSRGILLDDAQKPLGGKWTFDTENRLRYPKNKQAPAVHFPAPNPWYQEAGQYVQQHFGHNYGAAESAFVYPLSFQESEVWLEQFIRVRFDAFGEYEDAIVAAEGILHHSVLTPMLNVGLLTPQQILDAVLAEADRIPLNSLEGFVRQLIGWREFIRGVYVSAGSRQRTTNYWGFRRKIPASFWTGTTGIEPIDITIRKVLQTGYCHHIERLMVLGNFMLLCEFDPDDVYRWFMELFIDAYDWVMVPNVYGMTQFADGGLLATKPYISGSNYLMKMSDYPKGAWQQTWDGLFWRFMHVHRDFFEQNPRLGMLVKTFDKMPAEKQASHLHAAEAWLASIS